MCQENGWQIKIKGEDKLIDKLQKNRLWRIKLKLFQPLTDKIFLSQAMSDFQEETCKLLSCAAIASVEVLNISRQPLNCLKRSNLWTVQDVINFLNSDKSLLTIKNLGVKGEEEILRAVQKYL